MDVIQALRTGLPLRRPILKHKGSCKSGWLGNQYVKDLLLNPPEWYLSKQTIQLFTEYDLLADDWEVKYEQV